MYYINHLSLKWDQQQNNLDIIIEENIKIRKYNFKFCLLSEA